MGLGRQTAQCCVKTAGNDCIKCAVRAPDIRTFVEAAAALAVSIEIGNRRCHDIRDRSAQMIDVFASIGVHAIAENDDKGIGRRMDP